MSRRCQSIVVALFLIAASFTFAASTEDASSKVVVLNDENFEQSIGQGRWFIKFYAPWCGHCKHLAPIFAEAASIVSDSVTFGEVDCTQSKDTCSKYQIKGYPRMVYFDRGFQQTYKGDRTVDKIQGYIDLITRPALSSINRNDLAQQTKSPEQSIFVLLGKEITGAKMAMFSKMADENRGVALFYTTTDDVLVRKYTEEDEDALIVFRGDTEPTIYEDLWNWISVQKWVEQNKYPLVPELSPSNYERLAKTPNKFAVLVFINPSDQVLNENIMSTVYAVARSESGKSGSSPFAFAWVDYGKWQKFGQLVGLRPSNIPGIVAYQHPQVYYPAPNDIKITFQGIQEYLHSVRTGKIEATGEGTTWSNRIMTISENFMGLIQTNIEQRPLVVLAGILVPVILFFVWLTSSNSSHSKTD